MAVTGTISGITPAQLASLVNSRVQSMYAPEIGALQTNQAGVDQNYANEVAQTHQAAGALANILSPIGGEVKSAYSDASNADSAYAKGFSDLLSSMLGGDAGKQIGDVVYGLGGYYPSTALQREGAAFSSEADQMPQVAAGLDEVNTGKILGAQTKADVSFNDKLATLLGDEGKARETVQNDLISQAQRDRTYGLDITKLKNQIAQQKFTDAATVTRLKQSNARLNLESQRFARSIFQQNRQYSLSLSRLGISDKRLQLQIAKDQFMAANGGLTPSAMEKINSDAAQLALRGWNGYTDPKTNKTQGRQTYAQALVEELKAHVPIQRALEALNAVYPKQYQPTAAELEQYLGALDPQNFTMAPSSPGQMSTLQNPTGGSAGVGPAGGFLMPGATYKQGRKDQGQDFQTDPGAPIIAPGAGTVVAVLSDPSGFGPSYPVVTFTSGPYAGQTIYIGHTISALHPGASFGPGEVLSHTGTHPIGNATVPGWAEIGFAPNGVPGKFGQSTPFGG